MCFVCLLIGGIVEARGPEICPVSTVEDLFKFSVNQSVKAQTALDLRAKSGFARDGVYYAEQCLERDKENVGCIYYRAVNRGLAIETRTVKIKNDLKKMIDDFYKVIRLNDRYDNGGAYLALGYVYLKAPALPVLGKGVHRDLDRAHDFSKKALSIAPLDPDNLNLAGLIEYKRKNYKNSFYYFKKALKVNRTIKKPDAIELEQRTTLKKWVKKSKKKMEKDEG